MNFPRTGLMPFLEKNCYPLYFLRRYLEDVMKQREYHLGVRKRYNLKSLSKSDYGDRQSDTAFILGSGASINKMSERNWEEVARHYSIGMNMWLLHDFVPNAYSFEVDDVDNEFVRRETAAFYDLLTLRAEDYKNVLTMIRGSAVTKFYMTNPLPKELEGHTKVAYSLRFLGDDRAAREKYVEMFAKMMRLTRNLPWFPHMVAPGLSASILFHTCVCYMAGFKRVVLGGVDLNSTTYFFEEPLPTSRMAKENWPPPPRRPMVEVHPTFDRKRYSSGVNVKDHFLMLKKYIFDKDGFELFSGNPNSALVPDIPAFQWD